MENEELNWKIFPTLAGTIDLERLKRNLWGTYLMTFVMLAGQFHSNQWVTFALRLNLDLVKRVKTFSALHIYLGHQTLTLVAFSNAPVFFFSPFQFFKVGVVILFSQALVLIVTVSKKLDRHPGWLVFGAVPFKCITLDLYYLFKKYQLVFSQQTQSRISYSRPCSLSQYVKGDPFGFSTCNP